MFSSVLQRSWLVLRARLFVPEGSISHRLVPSVLNSRIRRPPAWSIHGQRLISSVSTVSSVAATVESTPTPQKLYVDSLVERVKKAGENSLCVAGVVEGAIDLLLGSQFVKTLSPDTASRLLEGSSTALQSVSTTPKRKRSILQPFALLDWALTPEELRLLVQLHMNSPNANDAQLAESSDFAVFTRSLEQLREIGIDLLSIAASDAKMKRVRFRILTGGDPRFVSKLTEELKSFFHIRPDKLAWVFKHVAYYISMEDDVRRKVFERVKQELVDAGLDETDISKIVSRIPTIFAYRPGRIQTQIDFLVGKMGMSPSSARKHLTNLPWSLAVKESHYEASFAYLVSQGFSHTEARNLCRSLIVVRSSPAQKLKPVIDFALAQGYSHAYIANHPYVFTYSLTRRIVPRYKMWQRFVSTSEVMPLTYLTKADDHFARFLGIPLEIYKQFTEDIVAGRADNLEIAASQIVREVRPRGRRPSSRKPDVDPESPVAAPSS